jgi:hypothetical protein
VLDDQSAKVVRRYRFIPTALIASDVCSRHMFLATDSKTLKELLATDSKLQILGCGVVILEMVIEVMILLILMPWLLLVLLLCIIEI